MNLRNLILSAALTVLSAAALAQSESASMRAQAEAFFNRHDAIINRGDLNGFMNLLTKDYVMVDKQGQRMDKAQMRAMIQGMMSSTRNVRSNTLVKNVQLQTQEASVWVLNTMTWDQRINGRWVKQKMSMRSCETLVRSGSGWKIKYSQELMTDEPWSFKTGGM